MTSIKRISRRSLGWVGACYLTGTLLLLYAAGGLVRDAWAEARALRFPPGGGDASLVLLFRPEDCESHQPVITALNQVQSRGRVPVRGEVLARGSDQTGDAAAAVDAAFPVSAGSAPRLAQDLGRLGFSRTPILVVVDARGRPLLIAEASDTPWEQVDAVRIAERIALHQHPTVRG